METVKIARETIEGLFNLQVGLAEDTIQSLCAGIAECIAGYGHPQPHACCCATSSVSCSLCSLQFMPPSAVCVVPNICCRCGQHLGL